MSTLREQISAARSAYESKQYPGDLASQILPPATPGRRSGALWLFPAVLGGLAAAAAFIVVFQAKDPTSLPLAATPVVATKAPAPVVPQRQFAYAMPARLQISLPGTPLMPAMPPVTVSLSSFPQNLEALQPYHQKLMEQLNRAGFTTTPAGPRSSAPEILPAPFQMDAV